MFSEAERGLSFIGSEDAMRNEAKCAFSFVRAAADILIGPGFAAEIL
jgi:hypothetical protein